jgi:uncharacterized membrane protein YkvA (DUF1232 family)
MLNKFFNLALGKAARMSGKPTRLLMLLSQMAKKLKDINWKTVKASQEKEKLFTLGRLIKAYALGQYRQVPWKTILLIIAAIIYFVNPIDLIPDLLPITGLSDDFAVLLWVYGSVSSEIDKFLTWEKSQVTPA